MPELLHITAHLGGGVGKVLSRLVECSSRNKDGFRHVIACLEKPEKDGFPRHVEAHGGELLICPSRVELERRIAAADIVQVEWWHHPVVAGWLCSGNLPPMRLVVWSHVSGLPPPVIPPAFVTTPHRFLFSSPCSLEHPDLAALPARVLSRAASVFSSGGFDDLPPPPRRCHDQPLRIGYVGTLNFAKLHPHFIDYLAAVRNPDFRLCLVGDPTTANTLKAQAAAVGLADRIVLRGYQSDIATELANLDVLAYLLNPLHYGTTENALLEAMAMGVIPVTLDNPAECKLIRHGKTGLLVDSPNSFAVAIDRLANSPDERSRLSAAAESEVRRRFAVGRTADALRVHYDEILDEAKRPYDFRPVFGDSPAEWFRSSQGNERWRFLDSGEVTLDGDPPHFLFENTKSSAIHFSDTYPNDRLLACWKKHLKAER